MDENPFSDISREEEEVRLLREDELEQVINGPLSPEQRFTRGDLLFIRQLAGRHPVLIRTACFHLFEVRYHTQEPLSPNQLRARIAADSAVVRAIETLCKRVEPAEVQDALFWVSQGRMPSSPTILHHLEQMGVIDVSAPDPWILGQIARRFLEDRYRQAAVRADAQRSILDGLAPESGILGRLVRRFLRRGSPPASEGAESRNQP